MKKLQKNVSVWDTEYIVENIKSNSVSIMLCEIDWSIPEDNQHVVSAVIIPYFFYKTVGIHVHVLYFLY